MTNGQELADQFSLPFTATVGGVEWYGSYYKSNLPTETATQPFTIRFFGSVPATGHSLSLGNPTTAASVPLYTADVNAHVMPSGIPFAGTADATDPDPTRITYRFSAALDGLTLARATEYWISITAGSGSWRWANSTPTAEDYSVYRMVYLGETNWNGPSNSPSNLQTRGDLAFALYGSEVPEPATCGMLALGAAAIAFASRFTKSQPRL